MASRQAHPVGIPIVRTSALVGPLLRRLLRWFLAWFVLVLVVWALMPSLLRLADIAVADGMPTASTVLPIDRSDDAPFRTSPWCKTAPAKDVVDVVHRDVDIDLRGGAASANLSAKFDVCGARLAQVVETMAGPVVDDTQTRDRVAGMVFGYLNFGGGERRSAPLRLEGRADTPTATVSSTFVEALPAVPVRASGRQVFVTPSAWTAATTHVRIRFDPGSGVWSSGAAPLRQDDGAIEWMLAGSDAFVSVNVEAPTAASGAAASPGPTPPVAASSDAVPAARPATTGSLLLRLLAGQVGGLRSVWLGITLAVPFLLLWSWASRLPGAVAGGSTADDALLASLREGCVVAGGVIAALVMLELAETVAADLEWLPNRVQLFNLGWSAAICKTALVASAWIGFGSWRAAPLPARGALPLAACGLVVATAGWSIDPSNLALLMHRTSFAPPVSSLAVVALAVETVGALLVAAAITAESFRWGIAARGAIVLVAAVGVVAVGDHAQIRAHLSVLSALFALPFGWAFVSASRVWVPGMPRPSRWTLLLGALGAALLALPPDRERDWSQAWLVGSTAWALVRWWQLPALALLVLWFARADRSPAAQRSSPAPAEAAAVFLFVLFFWNAQLPPLPLVVEAAAGVAILRWGLFVARPLPAPTRRRRLVSKTVDDLRSFNALTRLRRGLRKALDDKLAKGELDAQEWLDRNDRNDRVIRRRVATAARGKLRAMLALNVGPRGTAWQRGVRGAVVTTVIAMPWIATFVTHTSFETRYPTNAATLSQVGALLFTLLRWPALGFFFLYFYPLIRGVNGIQKGLVLAAGLIVPSAAATLVSTPIANTAWAAFALWSLQVFICCMSVGVGLGDLGALRKVGKGPRALVEIYDLGTLTAWFTSLAIAVGAAATTAIASGAGAVLTVGLKLLIPEAQTTAGPH